MSAARAKLKCPRCGYEWEPRVADPKKCPRCGYWLQRWEVKRDGRERGEAAHQVREASMEQEVQGEEEG